VTSAPRCGAIALLPPLLHHSTSVSLGGVLRRSVELTPPGIFRCYARRRKYLMKPRSQVILVLLLLSVGTGAASAQSTGSSAIIGRALTSSPLADDLRRLTDEIGGRVSGTPAMARAIDWALSAFREAGIAAYTESYTMPLTWSEGVTRLEILNGPKFAVALVAEGWSAPTPAEGIEAELLYIANGTEADFARVGKDAHGAILLVDAPVIQTWDDLDNEYDRALPIKQRAVAAGARAVLWTSGRERPTHGYG
jgi:carboxypeptidase Q